MLDRIDVEGGLPAFHAYVAEHGHGCVPQRHVTGDGARLGSWVNRVRSARLAGTLTDAQIGLLDGTPGWEWSAHDAAWRRHLNDLAAYLAVHGAPPSDRDRVDGFPLGNWARIQRTKYRNGELTPDRVDALNTLPGWSWTLPVKPSKPVTKTPVARVNWAAWRVVDLWWAGENTMRLPPLTRLVVPSGIELPKLIRLALSGIGFWDYDTHLWGVYVPDQRKGQRRVTTQVRCWFHVPETWQEYVCDDWWAVRGEGYVPEGAYNAGWRTLDNVASHRDEFWLIYDLGDEHTFRVRVTDASMKSEAAKAARAAYKDGDVSPRFLLVSSLVEYDPATIRWGVEPPERTDQCSLPTAL